MREDIEQALRKFENKHYTAVQTDTKLEYTDSVSLERKARQFWDDFATAKSELRALLEKIG